MTQQFSDTTQLAGMRVAISAIGRDMSLSESERAYWRRVAEAVADRIEDSRRRRREAQSRPADGLAQSARKTERG